MPVGGEGEFGVVSKVVRVGEDELGPLDAAGSCNESALRPYTRPEKLMIATAFSGPISLLL